MQPLGLANCVNVPIVLVFASAGTAWMMNAAAASRDPSVLGASVTAALYRASAAF